jgi:hypothetical protein
MIELLWIFISYLLGSIPFGFIIARVSGKNILEIGWRKTSGSNVFKNVGKWQGVLTGILDLLKGYLAVRGAQYLGFSSQIQIFSGIAAVVGHNWSIFISFSGGRGIGTFVGGFLALSPKILGFSFPVFLFFALLWNSSIATLLFLATPLILSFYLPEAKSADVYSALSLIPILIKRLSPLGEIFKSEKKTFLFKSRILLDNDEGDFSFRIKRIIKKFGPGSLRILINSITLPPKIAWAVAKFGIRVGVKVVKAPIDFILKEPEKIITEIKVEDLKKMMEASAHKIVLHQEEINKINVFPVADKDTGYNLAATLLGIEGVISQRKYEFISQLAKDIKEGAMINARGNAGMIYTGYLIGLLDEVKGLNSIDAVKFSVAMKKGAKTAHSAILNPVEGTILDVVDAAASKAYELARVKKEKNIIKVLEEAEKISQQALAETKEKLEVLKQNDVVDAGGLGFVKILEAWLESLKGLEAAPQREIIPSIFNTKDEGKMDYRYEVIFMIKKKEVSDLENLKKSLAKLGGSIDFLESEEVIKIHIHTAFPDKVKEEIKNFDILDWRLEDIKTQSPNPVKKRYLGLVVGETANLPREFLEKNRIEVVPFKINFPEKDNAPTGNFFEKIKRLKKLPTTATATFNDYFNAYKRALEKFEKILVITLPSRLSGAYSQARIARSIFKKPEKNNIFVFDCLTAEVAEGLVAMRIQELILQGKRVEKIIEDLKIFCPKVKLLALIDNFKYVTHGGRIKMPLIFTGLATFLQKIGIKFLLGLEDGKVKFFGVRFDMSAAEILAEETKKRSGGRKIRVAISFAEDIRPAKKLEDILRSDPKVEISFISPVSPLIGVHTGPGVLIAAFYPIDN